MPNYCTNTLVVSGKDLELFKKYLTGLPKMLDWPKFDDIEIYYPKGCDECNGTGYKGRVGLHELLIGTDAIKKNIQEHARVAEMFATALEHGMRTLKQDGMEKCLSGVTSLKEVRSVCIK